MAYQRISAYPPAMQPSTSLIPTSLARGITVSKLLPRQHISGPPSPMALPPRLGYVPRITIIWGTSLARLLMSSTKSARSIQPSIVLVASRPYSPCWRRFMIPPKGTCSLSIRTPFISIRTRPLFRQCPSSTSSMVVKAARTFQYGLSFRKLVKSMC